MSPCLSHPGVVVEATRTAATTVRQGQGTDGYEPNR
jgi:hypothetical protein